MSCSPYTNLVADIIVIAENSQPMEAACKF